MIDIRARSSVGQTGHWSHISPLVASQPLQSDTVSAPPSPSPPPCREEGWPPPGHGRKDILLTNSLGHSSVHQEDLHHVGEVGAPPHHGSGHHPCSAQSPSTSCWPLLLNFQNIFNILNITQLRSKVLRCFKGQKWLSWTGVAHGIEIFLKYF